MRHTPRFIGEASRSLVLDLAAWTLRGLRMSWLIVGIAWGSPAGAFLTSRAGSLAVGRVGASFWRVCALRGRDRAWDGVSTVQSRMSEEARQRCLEHSQNRRPRVKTLDSG